MGLQQKEPPMQATMIPMTREAANSTQVEAKPPRRVRVEYSNIEDFLVDYTSNETIGGMFIKTAHPMAVGTQFKLRVQLPGGRRSIDTRAEVRWTLPTDVAAPMTPGMGVRFDALSTIDKRYVESLLSDWR
jgi:type IV pilus assembly protein PilZ